ncbi:hypothetical protein AAHA92_31430 [Salvia divinorum]|uniref:Uncharacterized protein n=1 Tax=Salvia divinorum TaxID=28513 RepID=A0ABD1FQ97_SALDI
MELSNVFGFLKIVKESIIIVPKNGRIMVSITLLSLLLPSLVTLLFLYTEKSLKKKMDEAIMVSMRSNFGLTPSQIFIFHFAVLILVSVASIYAIGKISSYAVPAVILLSAMSYTGKKASIADLLARINREHARQDNDPGAWMKSLAVAVEANFVMNYDHNAITGSTTIVCCIIIFFYQRYVWVVGFLATVVAMLEERCEALTKKAEMLVVGHRLHGFMLNLFLVFPIWNAFLAYRIYVDDNWYLNMVTHGLFLINNSCLGNIFFGVTYTVLYFRCKKHHGQEIDDFLGNE